MQVVPRVTEYFSAEGVHVWQKDVLEFLDRYLMIETTDKKLYLTVSRGSEKPRFAG